MKGTHLVVRPAAIKDCKSIHNFICDLEETEFEYSNFEDLYTLNIGNPENIYLVAEVDGLISGYVSCHGQILLHHGGRVFEIQELYVKKEFRNKGIGQLLIKSLESELNKLNFKSLEVTANHKRTKTHDFYLKMGFESTHLKFTKAKS